MRIKASFTILLQINPDMNHLATETLVSGNVRSLSSIAGNLELYPGDRSVSGAICKSSMHLISNFQTSIKWGSATASHTLCHDLAAPDQI